MQLANINFLAVLVASIISMVLGSLWYSPVLFGKIWMKEMKLDKKKLGGAKKKGMGNIFFAAFISTLVLNSVLAALLKTMNITNALQGAQTAAWLWLGFAATVQLGGVLWEGKTVKAFLINTAHELVGLLISGALLAAWL